MTEQTPLEQHLTKFPGLPLLNQACEVVGMRIYTANGFEFTIQEADGYTFPYANDEDGIEKAWIFVSAICEWMNQRYPLNGGRVRVLPERPGKKESTPLPPVSPVRKYQRVLLETARLEDIELLFDMTADWLEGFDGDQQEACAALSYLRNTLFPHRMAYCEDCGSSNAEVGYHTEVHQGERSQCLICFKRSYAQQYGCPWPYPTYPSGVDEGEQA